MTFKILQHNKWMLAYLLLMCGIIIVYAAFVLDAEERLDLIVYNGLFTVLLPALFLLTTGRMRQLGLILFYFFAIPATLVESGWFLIDKSTIIRNQFWGIFATNPEEAAGFLSMFQFWQWLVIACFIGASVWLLVLAVKECKTPTRYLTYAVGFLLMASLCLIPGIRRNVPCINLYNSYRGYNAEVQLARQFLSNRRDLSGLVQDELMEDNATVVVIIGESLNKK